MGWSSAYFVAARSPPPSGVSYPHKWPQRPRTRSVEPSPSSRMTSGLWAPSACSAGTSPRGGRTVRTAMSYPFRGRWPRSGRRGPPWVFLPVNPGVRETLRYLPAWRPEPAAAPPSASRPAPCSRPRPAPGGRVWVPGSDAVVVNRSRCAGGWVPRRTRGTSHRRCRGRWHRFRSWLAALANGTRWFVAARSSPPSGVSYPHKWPQRPRTRSVEPSPSSRMTSGLWAPSACSAGTFPRGGLF